MQLGANVWSGPPNNDANIPVAAGNNASLPLAATVLPPSRRNNDDDSDVDPTEVMNGFVEDRAENEDEDPSTCEENTDSENLYDDNFEDYDEHYPVLHADSGPILEDFHSEEVGLNLEDDYDNDLELSELSGLVLEDCDNRFAPESHEEDSNRM